MICEKASFKPESGRVNVHVRTRAFQFGQKKVSIRFDSILAIESIFLTRQSDKFAACTLIFK